MKKLAVAALSMMVSLPAAAHEGHHGIVEDGIAFTIVMVIAVGAIALMARWNKPN